MLHHNYNTVRPLGLLSSTLEPVIHVRSSCSFRFYRSEQYPLCSTNIKSHYAHHDYPILEFSFAANAYQEFNIG